ncbi:MAG: hypothetical protein GQ574_09740 [Crocinitomix sp.]|nr:hypothetical protein [Crocinitomix sp.]
MNIYSKLLIIVFSLIAISCSKAKSPKWITGEFNIIDSETKEPVEADLKLRYYEGSLLGSWETVEEIGSTDENGYFELKQKVNRRDQQFKLEVFAKGWYGYYGHYGPAAIKEISEYGKNEYTIEVAPIYAYKLTFNNISCYDGTDSVWVTRADFPDLPRVYTGCLLDYSAGDGYASVNTSSTSLTTVSKKNGIYETIVHPLTLTQGVDNEFVINY